ncbi:response regulator transcription factor [Sulfurimonas sp. HSL-1716]|uniref:response regulator transcription factor n=1 Tax=Hydrocurvibacter sulfurireducens TaxID=3131937 RepID=UPI0031F8DF36
MSSKILLLEDDLLLCETIADLLEDEGYEVTQCKNGQEVLDLTYKERFDLYLLDINVPIINGLDLLKELRLSNDKTSTIFLTSHKEQEMLSIGFLHGADDYIKKPFDSYELLLRIKAVLKRYKGDENECIGQLCNDKNRKRIHYKQKELDLSQKEYALLSLLMKNANEVVTKEMIVYELWNNNEDVSDGAIRVYINRLKHFLDEGMIENIRAVGYRLVLQS